MSTGDRNTPYPIIIVTAAGTDYEEHSKWVFQEDPKLSPQANHTNFIGQLSAIWYLMCHNRDTQMKVENLWRIHPHLSHFEITRDNMMSKNRDALRSAINIERICKLIYNMERWYIPYVYGNEIIWQYVHRFPIVSKTLRERIEHPINLYRNCAIESDEYVRKFPIWNGSKYYRERADLSGLAKDMVADAFDTRYLIQSIRNDILIGFMKPLITTPENFEPNIPMLDRLNCYASRLIAVMAIMNDGQGVDNMCAIELWGAVRTFIENGYRQEEIDALNAEIHAYKRRMKLT